MFPGKQVFLWWTDSFSQGHSLDWRFSHRRFWGWFGGSWANFRRGVPILSPCLCLRLCLRKLLHNTRPRHASPRDYDVTRGCDALSWSSAGKGSISSNSDYNCLSCVVFAGRRKQKVAKERAGLAKVSSAHGLLPHSRKSKGWVTSFSHLSLFPNSRQSLPLLLFVIKL